MGHVNRSCKVCDRQSQVAGKFWQVLSTDARYMSMPDSKLFALARCSLLRILQGWPSLPVTAIESFAIVTHQLQTIKCRPLPSAPRWLRGHAAAPLLAHSYHQGLSA